MNEKNDIDIEDRMLECLEKAQRILRKHDNAFLMTAEVILAANATAIALIAAKLYEQRSQIIVAKYPPGFSQDLVDELLAVLRDIQHGGVAVIPESIELVSGQVVEIEVKLRDEQELTDINKKTMEL